MKPSLTHLSLFLTAAHTATLPQTPGFDISNWQPTFDFPAAYNSGARFCIMKATEGSDFKDKSFTSHLSGATSAGLIVGAYHFAWPVSNATQQADFFIATGGGWTPDGRTLPGMLDMESIVSKPTCWGLSTGEMVAWIREFSEQYRVRTTRYPMIYTNPSWWKECTGNSEAFKDTNPLVLARWASAVGAIPGGWAAQTIWQNSDKYEFGGDSDFFNGSEEDLKRFAMGL
ncbi:glycoside hydrolase family 25 protein [Podospora conica]|nr:glycoside hydrolase family 25 protein [Schizothecium conicum]